MKSILKIPRYLLIFSMFLMVADFNILWDQLLSVFIFVVVLSTLSNPVCFCLFVSFFFYGTYFSTYPLSRLITWECDVKISVAQIYQNPVQLKSLQLWIGPWCNIEIFNTMRPRQNRWHFAFPSAFSWMKMFEYRLKFHWSLFLRVQLTIFQHWFR